MNVHFKIQGTLARRIRSDLRRPHSHAAERIGFMSCRFGTSDRALLVLAHDYHPAADEHYEFDATVGARFSSAAIRSAMQVAISHEVGIFHVHLHDHRGVPRPSAVDWSEWARFVPDFWHVRPALPHGALIFSLNQISGWCWYPGSRDPMPISQFTVVDHRLIFWKVAV